MLRELIETEDPEAHLKTIDIISEKHGSDYHPARVIVHTDRRDHSFVANVALTERGRERLPEDFRIMSLLRAKWDTNLLPRPYFIDLNTAREEGLDAAVFLAEWFDDFHEFHLAEAGSGENSRIVLWDTISGHQPLSPKEASELYKQAAFILTLLYDMDTFEEVFPWHHAAGDFVARRASGRVDARLITARQYAPRVVFEEDSLPNRITALALFFANLTIRMRLDRVNGIGEPAWAGTDCVRAVLDGFSEGLQRKVGGNAGSKEFVRQSLNALQTMELQEWSEIFQAAAGSYEPDAPDTPVVEANLVDHIFEVYRAVRGI